MCIRASLIRSVENDNHWECHRRRFSFFEQGLASLCVSIADKKVPRESCMGIAFIQWSCRDQVQEPRDVNDFFEDVMELAVKVFTAELI